MSRCRQTAGLLEEYVRPAEVAVDDRLSAKNSGHLSGRPREHAALEAARRDIPIHKLRTPGGESPEDVQARYAALWKQVCASSERTTVLVGHGGGIACLLLWLTGNGFDRYLDHVPGPAAVTLAEPVAREPGIRFLNASEGRAGAAPRPRTAS